MGCLRTATVDDGGDLVALIPLGDDGEMLGRGTGVSLLFCEEHGEHFLRNWANLIAVNDASNLQIYVILGLTLEEHRAILMSGLRAVLGQWMGDR